MAQFKMGIQIHRDGDRLPGCSLGGGSVLWAIDNSLKSELDIFRPEAIIPFLQFTPTLDVWKYVLYDPQLRTCFFSSALVGLSTTVLVLLIGTPAGIQRGESV
jgi:ABC-type glycerol-3-phosphate transport system permease component